MITKISIMIVALTTGEEFALGFETYQDCSAALVMIPEIEADLGVTVDAATCIETLAPSSSPRPQPKPEVI